MPGGGEAPAAWDAETLAVAVVGRPHGTRGDVMLRPFNPVASALLGARRLILCGREGRRVVEVLGLRPAATELIAQFAGVTTRDAAASLTGSEVRRPRVELPPLGPDEFYVEDLPGCAVVDARGALRGTVRGTFWNGAHDVMTVVGLPGAGGAPDETLLPVVPACIRRVDAPARRIEVHWPDEGAEDVP